MSPSGLAKSASGSGAAAKAAIRLSLDKKPDFTGSRHSPFDPDVNTRRDGFIEK